MCWGGEQGKLLKGGKETSGRQCLHVSYMVLGWVHQSYLNIKLVSKPYIRILVANLSLYPFESQCSPHCTILLQLKRVLC